MNRTEAIQKDRNGTFYADYDPDSDCWGVFGSESGFCYHLFANSGDADEHAEHMNRNPVGTP